MTMFGLKEAEVSIPIRALTRDDLDRSEIEERFARATLSGIAEPGDRMMGVVVGAVGAPTALTALVDGWTGEQLRDSLDSTESLADVEAALARWQPRVNSSGALLALREAGRHGASLRVPSDPVWPAGLDALGDQAPLALWVRGSDDAVVALERSIAIVGARAATGYGEHVTMEASAGLVDRGYAIVSGGAYGIDGMAHRAALASHGVTIAFMAGGVDRFYPSGHEALLTRITESGAVISELPCGQAPTKWRFLQRNRLIAAASLATIVIEAGWRSGTLNTAGHAAQLGRPLGAVPGPVTSAASAGCHRLIREIGAELVTTPDEMAELAPLPGAAPSYHEEAGSGHSDPEATRVWDALHASTGRSVMRLAQLSGLAESSVRAALGRLELIERAREGETGWLRAKPKKAPDIIPPTARQP